METTRRRGFNSTALALIPLAIAINIAVGTIANGTGLYLDSIGTVLVGALLGPWVGLITGVVSNLIWSLFGSLVPAYFAYVAGAIGLVAGFAGRSGLFRRESPRWLSAIIGAIFLFALTLFVLMFIGRTYNVEGQYFEFPSMADLFARNSIIFILAAVAGAVAGYAILQRAGYAGLVGLLTGVLAAVLSAPMAAVVFGGVTGAGTDLLVAAFRASGANIIQSVFAQGVVSDPFDKMTSFLLVWLIIQSLPRRLLSRFPYGRSSSESYNVLNEPVASR